jgi:hypothetical protein
MSALRKEAGSSHDGPEREGGGRLLASPLDLLHERARTLAGRVRSGEVSFLDAVDFAYSAADFAGLVQRFGDDEIQKILATAFMDTPR